MSDQARLGQKVELVMAQGDVYAEGEVVGYYDGPTHIVRLADGTEKAWRSTLVRDAKPDISLPTEPTLGWLSWRIERANNSGVDLDFWSGPGDTRGAAMRGLSDADETSLYPADVTAFTEAVAVPKAALDELREWFEAHPRLSSRVNAFLAAIDEANRA